MNFGPQTKSGDQEFYRHNSSILKLYTFNSELPKDVNNGASPLVPVGIPSCHTVPSALHNPLEVSRRFLKALIQKYNQRVVLDREELGKHVYFNSVSFINI